MLKKIINRNRSFFNNSNRSRIKKHNDGKIFPISRKNLSRNVNSIEIGPLITSGTFYKPNELLFKRWRKSFSKIAHYDLYDYWLTGSWLYEYPTWDIDVVMVPKPGIKFDAKLVEKIIYEGMWYAHMDHRFFMDLYYLEIPAFEERKEMWSSANMGNATKIKHMQLVNHQSIGIVDKMLINNIIYKDFTGISKKVRGSKYLFIRDGKSMSDKQLDRIKSGANYNPRSFELINDMPVSWNRSSTRNYEKTPYDRFMDK